MRRLILLLLGALACQGSDSPPPPIEQISSGLWDIPNNKINGFKVDWEKTQPNSVATMHTTRGKTIVWEAWSATDLIGTRANQRTRRFPRAYKLTIENPNGGDKPEVVDLFDVGVQRSTKPVFVLFETGTGISLQSGAATPIDVPASAPRDHLEYSIPPFLEGPVHNHVTLTFSGPRCILWVPREGEGKPGDEGGSPPPPDPGDGTSEAP